MLRVKELILASLLVYGITAEIPEKAKGENLIGQQGQYCPNKDKETVNQGKVTCEIDLESHYTMDIRSSVSQIEIQIKETSSNPVGLANLNCLVPSGKIVSYNKENNIYKIRNTKKTPILMQCRVGGEDMNIQVKMYARNQDLKQTQITTFPKPED